MKKTIKIRFILAFLFLALLGSCDAPPWGCIEGNGRIVTEERITGDFNKIVSSGSFVVDIRLSNETGVFVETDENLLPYIETNIQGSTLVLETRNDRCIKSREAILIYVDAVSIEKIKLSGSGTIFCDNIVGETLEIELPGSGEISCSGLDLDYLLASLPGSGIIELGGTAATSEYTISGSGLIKAINLTTDKCYANIPGSGNIYTTVNDLLDVEISGSGNLYYQGNPDIIQKITGSGNIREYN
ncbi:MAG: DUF2807 domain-containing protein [Bacteroidales bacterium]|nr:DUF2807 domain-containing protein [Bacteroidales bacterium]MCF8390314.1 DUF2807 domain-containing protein [Bacteroidales bacterium]